MDRRLLLSAGALTALLPTGAGARRRKKTRTITRKFSTFDRISVSDDSILADPYPASLLVTGFEQGRIMRVQVTLRGITVQFTSLLHVLLVAPNGKTVELMSNVGIGHPASQVVLTLDDRARRSLSYNQPLVDGTFKPTRYLDLAYYAPAPQPPYADRLGALNGGNANGEWQLWVMEDNLRGQGGILGGWDLHITATVRR